MEMSGERLIAAPREKVWAALNDPDVLRQAIDGCESLDKVSDTQFNAKAVARLGPVKAKFGGKVTLSDLDPPNGYTLTGEGNGAGAGFAKGVAKVSLASEGEGTRLVYQVKADVSGKIAQIGTRLIEGSAKKLANEFFDRFGAVVSGEVPSTAPARPAGGGVTTGAAGGGAAEPWWTEPGWLAAGGVLAASLSMWVGFFIGRHTARTDLRQRQQRL